MDNSEINWELQVQEEAKKIGEVLFANFKHVLGLCMKYTPDELNKEYRAKVFETVLQAWVAGCIIPVASYADCTKIIEDAFVQEVRYRFDWIRKNEEQLRLDRMHAIANPQK